jgi:hypothetical protein
MLGLRITKRLMPTCMPGVLPTYVLIHNLLQLNGIEPLAWLTDVLERMVSGRTKANELAQLLPWSWKAERLATTVHARRS